MVISYKYRPVGEEAMRRIGREHAQRVGGIVRHNIRMFPLTTAEQTARWFLYGQRYYVRSMDQRMHPNCRCIVTTPPEWGEDASGYDPHRYSK